MNRICVFLFVLLFGGSVHVHALAEQDLESQYQAIREGDSAAVWKETFPRYKALAEKGHAKSQYLVGYRYWYGFGVSKSKSEARAWYIKAANNGYDMAAFELGKMYEEGDGVAKSPTESFKWYMKAAELGHSEAMSHVGGAYYRGDGVARSMTSAAYWFAQARDAGDAVGRMALASMEKSHPAAVRDMSKGTASLARSAPAPVQSASARTAPASVSQQPQIPAASEGFRAFENGQYARARSILLTHANRGNSDAQNVIGIMYLDGLGVSVNNRQAESWFRKAANAGNAAGQYHLAAMIYYQRAAGGVDPYGTAKSLLERASGQGSQQARTLLAQMAEDDRLRRIREKKEYDDSIDDITLKRCRNPRYVKVNGEEKMFCD